MFRRPWLLAFVSAVAVQSALLAQSPGGSGAMGCEETHRTLALRNPRLGVTDRILPGQAIVQAKLTLDADTTVRVIEYPKAGRPLDSYNATIIVRRGQDEKRYPMGKLMKDGALFRPVELASLCRSSNQGVVFIAFETPSTGMAEGFAVIQYSPESVGVQTLPPASQGRIVVHRTVPEEIELWSATGNADIFDCNACKKFYSIQDCLVGQRAVLCKQRSAPGVTGYPGKFIGARIQVR